MTKRTLQNPSIARLNELFFYDPDSGSFRRKVATVNGPVGSLVGGLSGGYLILWVDRRRYRAHRIAWAIHFGADLSDDIEIDHINGDKSDNRISNLRLATPAQNISAQGPRKNNTSGVRGVNFDAQTGKWRARIEVNEKAISLGRHDTFEGAVKARRDGEDRYFGEFAFKA
jgi:hypothetical protein